VPSLAGQPLEGFRETFFGARGVNELGFEAHILRGTVEHRFSDALSLTSRLQYADYDKSYRNAFPATPVTGTGANRQVGIEAYFDGFQRENLFSQTDLVWKGQTGALAHTLLAGVEFGRQDTGNQRVNRLLDSGVRPARRTGVNVRWRTRSPSADHLPRGAGNRSSRSEAEIFYALYLQARWKRAGRADRRPALRPLQAGRRERRDRADLPPPTDDLWSPPPRHRPAPIDAVSIYASLQPPHSLPAAVGRQFASLDLSLAALEPERFDNYEVGVKWVARPGLPPVGGLSINSTARTRAHPDPIRRGGADGRAAQPRAGAGSGRAKSCQIGSSASLTRFRRRRSRRPLPPRQQAAWSRRCRATSSPPGRATI
jgi:catecholate siderophore receptor